MATRTITTKLALEGESEYRAAIKNINAELALHKSELEKVAAQYSSSANSLEALQAKETALSGQKAALTQQYEAHNTMLEKAAQAQQEYAAQVERLRAQLDALKSSSGGTADEQENLAKELAEAEANLQKATNSVTYYQKQVNLAERDLANLDTELQNNEKYMEEARQSADGCATSIDQYGKTVRQAREDAEQFGDQSRQAVEALASALMAAGLSKTFKEITDAIIACVDASIEFESAMASVKRTVGGTDEEISAMGDTFKEMSTTMPITASELAQIASAAGQLGIARENVVSFTEIMGKLATTTDLTAESAATLLAQFANITSLDPANYDRLGATVASLGDATATTASKVVEMSQGMAASASIAGFSEREILAYAAAIGSLGIEAQAGSTSMSTLIQTIYKAVETGSDSLEQFASVADMTAAEFTTAFRENAAGAIAKFISGLSDIERNGSSAIVILDELGITNQRQLKAIQGLSEAGDLLVNTIAQANQAWEENTALTEKAGVMYETTESKLTMCENAFNNVKVAIGDDLTPVLDDLADAGTDAFSWAAEFVEEHPEVTSAISAVAAGVGVLTVAVTGYTVATKVAIPLITDFKAALAGPIGPTALAITTLVAAVGAFIATLPEATNETEELLESLSASQKAFEETTSGIRQGAEDTLSMMTALESLAAMEVKSTAQKQAMADMVAQLNQAVPELSLAYDELNDSLSMTAEDIRAVAQAQAEQQLREAEVSRLSELYVEQAQIATDLAAAEYQLEEAQSALTAAQEAGTYGAAGYEAETEMLQAAVLNAKKSVGELTAAQSENQTALEALEGKYGDVQASIEDTGGTAKTVAERIAELTSGLEDLSDETQSLVSEMDTLTGALQEQQEAGSLSLNTALDLIDAGYAAALSINEETGAVTLNKDAYIAIAAAKLDEQIASLQTQQTSVQTAIQLKQEAMAVLTDAWAYAELKAARDELEGLEGQSKAYQAQIAALQKLKDSLGNVTVATKATVSASQQAQTQAQKDLAAYQELKAALDHEKAMDLVSEREYYARLKEYRDQYLTDADNLSTYRQITEQIYSYDKSLVDAEAALWEEATETLAGELEERVASIRDAEDKMAQSLRDYGDLFTIEDDKMSLGSLQEQIDAINAYEEALTALGEKGISDGLMDEVLGMDVDEATQYAQQLISMTEEQWDEYNTLWEEKQRRAIEVAQKFYQDQLDALSTEYDDKLGEALSELTDTAYTSGVDTAQGLIDGLAAQESAMYAKARTMADEVSRILTEAHAVSGEVDGSHAAGLAYVPYDGYIAELHQGERVLTAEEARNYIARSMPRSYEPPSEAGTQQMIGSMLAQAVNGMATLIGGQGGQVPEEIVLKLQSDDGTTLGRWMVPFVRAEDKSNPEVVSDKL